MKSAEFSLTLFVVLSLNVASSMSAQVPASAADAHPVAATATPSGHVPFFLEANRGQAGPEVEFLARGKGFTLLVERGQAMLALTRPATPNHAAAKTVVSMTTIGSNPRATVVGERALPGRCNYYHGADPSKWIIGVPTYERAVVRDIYPGVNLVYRGNQRNLEYDFIVAPGRDPSTIRLAFDGVEKMTLGDDGNLILHTAGGEVIQKAPVTFQDAPTGRQLVASAYRILGDRTVGFDVGKFDRTRPLVIDPVLSYSSYLGGSAADHPNAIAVDGAGSVYVTGSTDSTNFPSTTGPTPAGGGEAFVTKVSTTGQLVYSTYLGGTSGDAGYGVAVDSAGYAYLCGPTSSNDLPVTPNAYDMSPNNGGSFVAKLDANGGLDYASYLDGAFAWALALGPGDTVYVTGSASAGLPTKPNPGAYQTSPTAGSQDAFLARMSLSGSGDADLVYATYLGGAQGDVGFSVATDSSGNAYLTGDTFNVTGSTPYFPTTANAFQPNTKNRFKPNGQYHSVFISKIDPSGNGAADLVYSTYLYNKGGAQRGQGIAADDYGRAYVTGVGWDNLPTTAGAFDETYNAGSSASFQNVFVVVLNTTVSGSAGLEYGTYLSGPGGSDFGSIDQRGATPGMAGDIYVAGRAAQFDTTPSVFPTTPDALQSQALGDTDAFVAKLSPGGNGAADLVFSTLLGGSGTDRASGVAVDAAGNIHIVGVTASNDFPTANAFQAAPGGGSDDGFVAKIQLAATAPPAAPTDLSATAISSSRIDLAWTDNAGDESGFKIERSPDGTSWAQIATVGANVTTYPSTGLAASTTYYYRVRAYNALGDSAYSNVANAMTQPPGAVDDTANGEIAVAGTVTGTYTDTHASDNTYEAIQERESGGRKANRYSFLEHKWTFNVTGGSSVTFNLQAHHSANSEGDNFVFAYSTDNVTFTDMVTVTKTADDDTDQTYVLPSSLSGTVYIRVTDLDQTQGNKSLDTIFIDHMFIRSE